MKKIIFLLTFTTTLSFADSYNGIVSNILSNVGNYLKETHNLKEENKSFTPSTFKINRTVSQYFTKKECNQVLNTGYFATCYDYNLKSAKYTYYKIDGNLVDKGNLKERPKFFYDVKIPKIYRTSYSDYRKSGYDRGHIVNDTSFDWSKKSQKSTYVMSNIVPQKPNTNRKSIVNVEERERTLSRLHGSIEVLQINNFNKRPKKIGRSKLSVPDSFVKVLFNLNKNIQECYLIPNDNKVYRLKDMYISCKSYL